jgi:hypothetical protein
MMRDRGGEAIQRGCHLRHSGAGSLRLHEREPAGTGGHQEVDLETLLVPEVVKLPWPSTADLLFQDF